MARIRAFIALTIPATSAIGELHARLAGLGRGIRPVALDKMHVTLKFLGDTEENQVAEVAAAMQRVAAQSAGGEIGLVGLGAFPNVRRPSVVWVGMNDGGLLGTIAKGLDAELAPLGFVPETRPFTPHLTVLRLKSRPPDALFELVAESADTDFGTVRVQQIELFRSELRPEGSRYTRLATAPLANAFI